MKVIVCAYRDWALRTLESIRRHPKISDLIHVTNNEDLEKVLNLTKSNPRDMVLFVGWSSPPTEEMVNMGIPMFSEHPATSDRYSPGTPLQNQILDGKKFTKHRLVKVGFPELAPRQWSHEVDMDLSGNMDDILFQMDATARQLFNMFLDDFPNIAWKTWDEVSASDQVPRRTPDQSRISREDVASLTTARLYDMMRCLESPYPNAYLEDDHGYLYFEKVRFKKK